MIRKKPQVLAAVLLAGVAIVHSSGVAARDVPQGTAVRPLDPVRIWPNGAPPVKGWPGYAHPPVAEATSADGTFVSNVSDPTYQAFLPAPDKASGTAVIVAPGGGFRGHSIRTTGTEIAQWLAQRGIAAFVLKYRTVPVAGDMAETRRALQSLPRGVPGRAAVADGLEALRQIRVRAAEYGIRQDRVGVVGFSAGGHVAGMMAIAADPAVRVDFAGLIYGMPYEADLVALPEPFLVSDTAPRDPGSPRPPVPGPERLPPIFMAMAQDDTAAGTGFRMFYDRLFGAGYRPELHLYQRGGHGFGLSPQGGTSDLFAAQFLAWMQGEGFARQEFQH